MDVAGLRAIFSSRIRKLREGKMNQGEFADSVGVSRGAMSYYEQELRTPDIGVLRAICAEYKVSADYLLGLMPDKNHAVSDVCKEIGLSPETVRNLKIIKTLAETEFRDIEHVADVFDEDFVEVLKFTPYTSMVQVLNTLLEHTAGMSLLTLIGAIINGAEISQDENEAPPTIKLKSSSKTFEVSIPIENLTAALWVNIQEEANTLRDKMIKETPQHE